jgi:outer membrane protein OmpA-like peptidoglycan-associated protein
MLRFQSSWVNGCLKLALSAAIAVALPVSAAAQSDTTPTWDVFVGYQYLHPGGTVPTPFGDPNNPTPFTLPDLSKGFGSTVAYNFDPHWAAELDLGHDWVQAGSNTVGTANTTLSVGPRFMWRADEANFFIHGLVGPNHLAVDGLKGHTAIGVILGAGMDLNFSKWLSWRVFEVNYQYAQHNFADAASANFPDLRRPNLEGVRLRTGLVFSWGGAPQVAPVATCTVQPSEVFVGDPLTANVTTSNFNPKHPGLTYSWTGPNATGKDTSARIDTTNAAPGNYTVTAHVVDPKEKRNNDATCSANYTVKALPPKNPPTMSCSADPASVVIGGSSNVTCTCTSPDGVPVSVGTWTTSSGNVSGNAASASLSTAGVAAGPVTVGATCTDSRGLSTQASTQVTAQNPPPPQVDKALEARLALHSIYFVTDKPSIKAPTGGIVASQEKTLTALAADFKKYLEAKPDAHLILEGHADPRGGVVYNQALSERRVARTKGFLVDQGVPEADIDTKAFGEQRNLTAAEVKQSIEQDADLTKEERARILRNMHTIVLAANRRVDVTLSTTGETSVRKYPFNAEDSLALIGGRTSERKAAPPKKGTKKKK